MRLRFGVYHDDKLVWAFDDEMPFVPKAGEWIRLDSDITPYTDSEHGDRSKVSSDYIVDRVAYVYAPHLGMWRPGIRLRLAATKLQDERTGNE